MDNVGLRTKNWQRRKFQKLEYEIQFLADEKFGFFFYRRIDRKAKIKKEDPVLNRKKRNFSNLKLRP